MQFTSSELKDVEEKALVSSKSGQPALSAANEKELTEEQICKEYLIIDLKRTE